MTLSAPSSQRARVIAARGTRSHALRLIALTPLWLGPIIYLMSPTFFGPKPELFGIPQNLVFTVGAMSWSFIGVAITWGARSWLADVLALLVFTVPAIVLMIIGPAVVLILQNLG